MTLTKDSGIEAVVRDKKNIAFKDSDGFRARGVVLLDSDGEQSIDFPSAYGVYKTDDDASPHYFGFEKSNGAWVIMRETLATGDNTYEYLAGSSDIATTWATRASETYTTFSNTF